MQLCDQQPIMKAKTTIETNKRVRIELSDEDIINFLVNSGTISLDHMHLSMEVDHEGHTIESTRPIVVSYTVKDISEDGEI